MEDQNDTAPNKNDMPAEAAMPPTPETPTTPASKPDDTAAYSEQSADASIKSAPPRDETPLSAATAQPVIGKMGKKRGKKKLLLVLLLVLLLAAGAAATYWAVTSKVKQTPTNQATVQETKEIEVIRIGTVDGPANNIFPAEGTGLSYGQNRQMYEGLVGNDGADKYVPLLATSWTNPDQSTWVFKLKPNVKFHTGKTMTATDVKRSLEAIQKLDYLAYVTSTIDTIEVVNDLEIKITTTEPDALLLNRLALAFITDQDAKDAEGNNGTGAYTLDKSAPFSESTATLVANDNYHQGRPKTRKLVYTVYSSDAEMVAALKEGKADMIDTVPDSARVADLKGAGFASNSYEAPGTFGLYMNMLKPDSPLKNKEVRKALAQAVNRQELVEKLDNDNQPATQVVPKSLPGHDASLSFPEFDTAAAKETLAKAGYPNGVTLEFVYVNEIQPDPPVLIPQLEAAGFIIERVAHDSVDTALTQVQAGEFDLFSAAYNSDLADSRDLLGSLLESKEQSYPVYKDAAYDKLLEDSDNELDPTKRIAILQEANKYITDNYLWIPLRSTAYISFFQPDFDVTSDFQGAGGVGTYFWKVGRKVDS